jgi:methylmalonyl-CoA mutase C-terminal domain/subunit
MKAVAAKIGLDGHFRGIKFVTRVLRDAGVEVVFLGFHNSAEQVVHVVVDEDATLLALSFLSPDYLTHVRRVRELLDQRGVHDVHIIVGGLVDPADVAELHQLGVDQVFGPETGSGEIVDYLSRQFVTRELPSGADPGKDS